MTNRPNGFSAVTYPVLSRDLTGAEPSPNGFSAVKANGFSAVTYPVLSRDLTGAEPCAHGSEPVKGWSLQVGFFRLDGLGQVRITGQFLQVSHYSVDTETSCVPAERSLAMCGSLVAEDKLKNSKGEQA